MTRTIDQARARLRRLDPLGATDLIGGYKAWEAAGLPVAAGPGR